MLHNDAVLPVTNDAVDVTPSARSMIIDSREPLLTFLQPLPTAVAGGDASDDDSIVEQLDGMVDQSPAVDDMAEASNDATAEQAPLSNIERLANRHFGGQLMCLKRKFIGYRSGCWTNEFTDSHVKFVLASDDFDQSDSELNKLLGKLRNRYYRTEFPVSVQHKLCLANGTLNLLTGVLMPHDPQDYLRNELKHSWDTDAKCPKWLKFLDELFCGDSDAAEKVMYLQEKFGDCLTTSTAQENLLLLLGSGGNGKSVLMDVLAALIGEANTKHTMASKLAKQEYLAAQQGMLLNLVAEVQASALKNPEVLKAYVSGNKMDARPLYGNPFTVKPTAKLVMAANALPKVIDDSEGFFRRLTILLLNNCFTGQGQGQNRNLRAELIEELPGILVWAVEGYQRLERNQTFTVPASSIETKARYVLESDDSKLFMDDCLEVDLKGRGLFPSALYARYNEWCKDNGVKPKALVPFGKSLRKVGLLKGTPTNAGIPWRVRFKTSADSVDTASAVSVMVSAPVIVEAVVVQANPSPRKPMNSDAVVIL